MYLSDSRANIITKPDTGETRPNIRIPCPNVSHYDAIAGCNAGASMTRGHQIESVTVRYHTSLIWCERRDSAFGTDSSES